MLLEFFLHVFRISHVIELRRLQGVTLVTSREAPMLCLALELLEFELLFVGVLLATTAIVRTHYKYIFIIL